MDRPIPVLQLINRFWIGGSERQFIEKLRQHPPGFEPVVACFERSGGLLPQLEALGIEPLVFPLEGSILRLSTIAQAFRLAELIKRRGIRIVHANEFTSNCIGLVAARLAGAKLIVNRVDLGHLRQGFGPMHRRVEMFTARAADHVLANADAVARLCIEAEGCAPEKVSVLRNGIDLPRFDAQMARPAAAGLPIAGEQDVAVVGNLWPVKNHHLIVTAAAKLREKLPKLRFLCAGDGPERPALEARIAALGLEGRVLLLGHRLDVPTFLSRAHAAVLASRAEGLSNAIIEAMAARLPVVASAVGGNPELVNDGKTGFLFPSEDADALADRLHALFSVPGRARELGRAGRRRVENELTLERMQQAHEALYRRVLGMEAPSAARNAPEVRSVG